MIYHKQTTFTTSDKNIDLSIIQNKTMQDFNDTFGFFLDTDSEIDLLDNPYIKPNVYSIN